MAVSRNRVDVMGYLGAAPELTYHEGFTRLAMRIAATQKFTRGDGSRGERTEWIACELNESRQDDGACGRRSAFLASALHRGSAVAIEGQIRTREWTDAQGQRHWMTTVRIDDLQLLDRAPSQEGGAS